jgi:hypothetical protein
VRGISISKPSTNGTAAAECTSGGQSREVGAEEAVTGDEQGLDVAQKPGGIWGGSVLSQDRDADLGADVRRVHLMRQGLLASVATEAGHSSVSDGNARAGDAWRSDAKGASVAAGLPVLGRARAAAALHGGGEEDCSGKSDFRGGVAGVESGAPERCGATLGDTTPRGALPVARGAPTVQLGASFAMGAPLANDD